MSDLIANIFLACVVALAMILFAAPTWAWLGLALAFLFIMNNIDLGRL